MLPDHTIQDLALAGMITPYNPDQLNPHSYDLRLGNEVMYELKDGSGMYSHPITLNGTYDARNPLLLHPGEFVLAHTEEVIHLPDDVGATLHLKSSRAREGFGHSLAGFIDCGYRGRLTLELQNHTRYTHLKLIKGMLMCQLSFHRLESKPMRTYKQTGRYQNDMTVQVSRG